AVRYAVRSDGLMGARREAREALAAAQLAPRKSFGQHFLVDENVVRRIVVLAAVDDEPAVLEIGPGLGALTDALAERARRLYLVEIDRRLAARLAERYAAQPRCARAPRLTLRGAAARARAHRRRPCAAARHDDHRAARRRRGEPALQ